MSWITIDVDEVVAVSQLAYDAMPEVVGVRDRLYSAGQQYGLGTAAGPVAAEATAIASSVRRVAEAVLTEVTDTLRRATALLEGEQTAQVACCLQGPGAQLAVGGSAVIGGGSVVGGSGQGWSLEGGSAVSDAIIGGGSV
ncbi:hypothetical protein, partial [Cellulomonas sp. URHD0024]|uniref:hypothetical protein n=1 Tax=Cellulomonas sp. URHD0024 TaxID=1302620 RepID=UPI0004843109